MFLPLYLFLSKPAPTVWRSKLVQIFLMFELRIFRKNVTEILVKYLRLISNSRVLWCCYLMVKTGKSRNGYTVSTQKISQLEASLPTRRQQVVFALLVPSCQQVCNKLLTIYNNLVDIIRNVARLSQQV